jgi:two-component system, NarL family, sensor histidine kinase UhpB
MAVVSIPEKAPTAHTGHFGLVGMRERVEGVGGRFEITTSPGDGTALLIEVPCVP